MTPQVRRRFGLGAGAARMQVVKFRVDDGGWGRPEWACVPAAATDDTRPSLTEYAGVGKPRGAKVHIEDAAPIPAAASSLGSVNVARRNVEQFYTDAGLLSAAQFVERLVAEVTRAAAGS